MSERWFTRYAVSVPEGTRGPWSVEKFSVDKDDPSLILYNLRLARDGLWQRQMYPGSYTRLVRNHNVIMSDTAAEVSDHLPVMDRMEQPHVRRVLIHGLGLGVVLQHAMRQPHIEHIDVVELDPDVIELVGPHYYIMDDDDDRVTIHQGDALTFQFPKGTRWDICWHDIWDTIGSDNLGEMALLNRRYGHRCAWQGCWSQELSRQHAAGRFG